MIRAVGFDLDGTLLDHRAAAATAIEACCPGWGVEPNGARWLALEDHWFPEYLAGRVSFQEQRRARMRAFLGREAATDELDGRFADYLEHYERSWAVDPHVVELLALLRRRGLALAVLTNGERGQQRSKLSRLGILDAFDAVLTVEDLPTAKPHPSAYQALLAAVGLAAHQVAFVGDDPHADGLGAHEAGLLSIWIDRYGGAAPVGPARVVSLAEVPDLLTSYALP